MEGCGLSQEENTCDTFFCGGMMESSTKNHRVKEDFSTHYSLYIRLSSMYVHMSALYIKIYIFFFICERSSPWFLPLIRGWNHRIAIKTLKRCKIRQKYSCTLTVITWNQWSPIGCQDGIWKIIAVGQKKIILGKWEYS